MGESLFVTLARGLRSRTDSLKKSVLTHPGDSAFEDFAAENLDKAGYLDRYPDVAKSGQDPLRHWLDHGIFEGRRLSPELEVCVSSSVERNTVNGWKTFCFRGKTIAVKRTVIPSRVLDQIMEQGKFDSDVFAVGAQAIGSLPQFNMSDILVRRGVDLRRLLETIPQRPRALVLMPFLGIGGSEKYASSIIESIEAMGLGPVFLLVTDQSATAAKGWESLAILAPLRKARIVFWSDYCTFAAKDESALARIVYGLAPDFVFVINSRIGLDMIARYGRGLSQVSKLFCAYFGLSPQAIGGPYGCRYPRTTLPFATALTDNGRTAGILGRLFTPLPRHEVVVLPPMTRLATHAEWTRRLDARRLRVAKVQQNRRWIWISRIEPLKGLKILNRLATLRGKDDFDIFGPASEPLPALGVISPNINHCGTLEDVAAEDFSNYDGFVFTSLFEGMPNIVLEMAQHAIPMVLTRVGGLDETFSEDAVTFVEPDRQSAAEDFARALAAVASLPQDGVEQMVQAAYDQTKRRHAPEVFRQKAAGLFKS